MDKLLLCESYESQKLTVLDKLYFFFLCSSKWRILARVRIIRHIITWLCDCIYKKRYFIVSFLAKNMMCGFVIKSI
jgi:hypothetical protein